MADLEASFLSLANDGAGVQEEKKEPESLFKNAGKMRDIFEIEQKSKTKGKKPVEAAPQLSKAEEEERVTLIRRYNEYMRDQIISRRLTAAGYQVKVVSYDLSLSVIRGMWKDVEDCLSGGESRVLAYKGVSMLNQLAMKYQPILAEEPSLQQCFEMELTNPDSNMCLSMAELSIRLQPYTPSGFFARFAASYGMMINSVVQSRTEQKTKEADSKFKEEDVKKMEEKYSGL